MKTPWSDLLKHGIGLTTVLVMAAIGLVFFTIMGAAILIAKILAFIK